MAIATGTGTIAAGTGMTSTDAADAADIAGSPATGRGVLVAAFVGLGISAAVPPALLPVLAQSTGSSPERLSLVVSMVFGALWAGVLATAALAWAPERSAAVGSSAQAAGLVGFAVSSSLGGLLVSAALVGFGFGASELSATAMMRRTRDTSGRGLTGLTAALALTSAGTPVVLGLLAVDGRWRAAVIAGAVVHVVTSIALLRATPRATSEVPATPWAAAMRRGGMRLAVALYVGAETVLAAWIARTAADAFDLSSGAAAGATTAFWLALAAGRLGGTAWLARHPVPRPTLVALLGAATVLLAVAAASGGTLRLAAVVLALVCCGPVYALVLTIAPGTGDVRVLAVLVACGAAGGAIVSAAAAPVHGVAGLGGVLLLGAGTLAGCVLAVLVGSRRSGSRRSEA